MAASILLPGPTLPKLSTNIDRQIDLFSKNNMSFSRAIFGDCSSKIFTDFFLVIPCFHIAKGDIWAPLVSSCGRSHTILFIPFHMMTSFDTASVCQSMLVENDVRMGVPSWVHKELSKSYREGTAQKLKSMALPYKTKVRKKWPKKISTEKRQNPSEIDVLKIARNSRTLWWSGIKF